MKKIILFIMMIIGSISFAAKELYVGTNAEFKPYEYLEDGKIVGFDIELMEEIGKEIGYKIVWKNMRFEGLISALQTKKIDAVIAGMAATEERKKAVSFSNPYLAKKIGYHDVIVSENSTLISKEELKGKTVGTQVGTIQEGFAKDLGGILKPYDSFVGALMAVQQEKIDAVILADVSAVNYLKTMKGLKTIGQVIDESPGASIGFIKGETILVEKVNQALENIQNSGKYDIIYKKYFPEGHN
ncbi:MAG: transporter substrate-binding domain-containing protein [Fusobacteriaceae bacterium]